VEYKRPASAYPLRDFHRICRVCTPFQDALGAKIWLDLLEGLWSYEGFNLRGSGFPKYSAPPSGETMRQTPKSFRGARMCSRFSITVLSLVGLGLDPRPGQPKTFLNVRDCAPDFVMKALEYRNELECSCAPVFNFLRLLPICDTTKFRNAKYGKIWQNCFCRQRATE